MKALGGEKYTTLQKNLLEYTRLVPPSGLNATNLCVLKRIYLLEGTTCLAIRDKIIVRCLFDERFAMYNVHLWLSRSLPLPCIFRHNSRWYATAVDVYVSVLLMLDCVNDAKIEINAT